MIGVEDNIQKGDVIEDKGYERYIIECVHMNGDVKASDAHGRTWFITRYDLRRYYTKIHKKRGL